MFAPDSGAAGADIAAIGADRVFTGPISYPKPPPVSASQLISYRFLREMFRGD